MRLKDLLNRDTQDLPVIVVTDEASPLGQYNISINLFAAGDSLARLTGSANLVQCFGCTGLTLRHSQLTAPQGGLRLGRSA